MHHELHGLGLGFGICLIALAMAEGPTAAPQATGPAATVDVDAIGPKIGETLPDFTLPDQHGAPHSLKSILGPDGAVIVFFRSADW
jgi:hypothetical protein